MIKGYDNWKLASPYEVHADKCCECGQDTDEDVICTDCLAGMIQKHGVEYLQQKGTIYCKDDFEEAIDNDVYLDIAPFVKYCRGE